MKRQRWRFGLLGLAGVLVLAWLGWHSRNDLVRVFEGVSPYWISASICAGILLNVVYGLLFDRILAKYNGRQCSILHVAVYLMSQPAKYVPGKVWQAVMQSIALRGRSSLTSVGVTNIELSVVAVLHASGLGLGCLLAADQPALGVAVAALTIATGWVVVRFPTGRILVERVPYLRRFLQPTSNETKASTRKPVSLLFLTTSALATTFAAAWWLLVAAHTGLTTQQTFHLLASLWLGIAASLLALPIPAGLGIREAAVAGIGTVLAPDVPTTMLISIALFVRGWQLLVDALSLCVGWLLWQASRHKLSD